MLSYLIKLLPTKPVFAHCDIPCGIYDPHMMQMAAHTVIRMTELITEAHKEGDDDLAKKKYLVQIARMTRVKEEHCELCEKELVTFYADAFKEEHFEKFPELKDLIYKSLKLAGKARVGLDMESAKTLLENTQKIAEIFWKTKGLESVRVPSGYPTEGEIVTHK